MHFSNLLLGLSLLNLRFYLATWATSKPSPAPEYARHPKGKTEVDERCGILDQKDLTRICWLILAHLNLRVAYLNVLEHHPRRFQRASDL